MTAHSQLVMNFAHIFQKVLEIFQVAAIKHMTHSFDGPMQSS